MPWKVENRGGEYVVVREGTEKVVGKHSSRSKALAQLRALYAAKRYVEKGKFASRSEAGRYAAEQRWKGNSKKDTTGEGVTVDAIKKLVPAILGVRTSHWGLGDDSILDDLIDAGVPEEEANLMSEDRLTLSSYANGALAAGNCGIASVDVGQFLLKKGVVQEGEVFLREVGEPWYGEGNGTHFVTHIGPQDSDDAIIIDFTLRQFDPNQDFPWIGTVREYKELGYETPESIADGAERPEMLAYFEQVAAPSEAVSKGSVSLYLAGVR